MTVERAGIYGGVGRDVGDEWDGDCGLRRNDGWGCQIPACAGMTVKGAGMTVKGAGMTVKGVGMAVGGVGMMVAGGQIPACAGMTVEGSE